MRKSLGLDWLPVKVNKQQTTSTLELWVLYQQLKLTAAADAAKSSGQQLVEGTWQSHNIKAHQPYEPTLSLRNPHAEAAGAQTQNDMPALQRSKLADNVAVGISVQIPAGAQPQHSGQHAQQACPRPDAL